MDGGQPRKLTTFGGGWLDAAQPPLPRATCADTATEEPAGRTADAAHLAHTGRRRLRLCATA